MGARLTSLVPLPRCYCKNLFLILTTVCFLIDWLIEVNSVLNSRRKRNNAPAGPGGQARASVTVCIQSVPTETRWCQRTCRKSNERISQAPFCRWKRWASTISSRSISWMPLRCRRWFRPWNNSTRWVPSMTRVYSRGLAGGYEVNFCSTPKVIRNLCLFS